jgi:hypothetical protein
VNDPIYVYEAPDESGETVIFLYRREDIIRDYWNFYQRKMTSRFGEDHSLITEENCIKDWITIHWAWPLSFPAHIRGKFI